MEPIQIIFVRLHSIPWPALLAFTGIMLGIASKRFRKSLD